MLKEKSISSVAEGAAGFIYDDNDYGSPSNLGFHEVADDLESAGNEQELRCMSCMKISSIACIQYRVNLCISQK